jgi:hypothetical protein
LPEPIVSSTIIAQFIKYYLEEMGSSILKPFLETDITQIDTSIFKNKLEM